MKPGDLVRNKNSESGMLGLFLEWYTFDPETNPYICPVVLWADGRRGSIQVSLVEVVNERH